MSAVLDNEIQGIPTVTGRGVEDEAIRRGIKKYCKGHLSGTDITENENGLESVVAREKLLLKGRRQANWAQHSPKRWVAGR